MMDYIVTPKYVFIKTQIKEILYIVYTQIQSEQKTGLLLKVLVPRRLGGLVTAVYIKLLTGLFLWLCCMYP